MRALPHSELTSACRVLQQVLGASKGPGQRWSLPSERVIKRFCLNFAYFVGLVEELMSLSQIQNVLTIAGDLWPDSSLWPHCPPRSFPGG